ncbi:jmjC domain-containing protein 4-like [Ctenocephalides felis]|uniref:jmjC domain-containing protein 4-like n=1 Tax=Ctenocephalides felis TaxID=7515 RepID=UPI000E6E1097|nr:jmjC domain-containing protein 4-like [Ctenocephalides felis]
MKYKIELSNDKIFPKSSSIFPQENVNYIHYDDLKYDTFFENYLIPNVPCIIKNATINWEASKHWIINDNINFQYITEKYGNTIVPIANCSVQYYNAQKKIDMKLSEYLNYFSGHQEISENLYLKDWHFHKDIQENIYTVPLYFASDWLNEYCIDLNKEDYMFIYMGPKDSWTPFHADVFSSFSWSANITGQKRWLLFPPDTEKTLVDNLGNLPFDIDQCEKFTKNGTQFYEVIQNPGEVLFVPSKWHHQVWNLKDTFSINHNWFNGCNINIVFESMLSTLHDIKKEISDCSDMDSYDDHCQLMLKSIFGMDLQDFFNILYHISIKRINKITLTEDIILFESYSLGSNHCKFDLESIFDLLKAFIENEDAMNIDWSSKTCSPEQLVIQIENTLM